MRFPILFLLAWMLGACASTTAPYQPELVNDVELAPDDRVEPPTAIEKPFPAWPPEYRERGIAGDVVAKGIVGLDGRLREVEITSTAHELLVPLLLEVLPKWRFEPATLNGEPVEVYYDIVQRFTLY